MNDNPLANWPGAHRGDWHGRTWVLDWGDFAAEHDALHDAVGLVDLSPRGQIEVLGDDRAAWLHNLCTNDIRNLAVGTGCEAFFCNAKGHIVGHGYVFAQADALRIDLPPGLSARLLPWLDRYIIRERVELRDLSATADAPPHEANLLLAGKAAGDWLDQLTGTSVPRAALAHGQATLAGVDVWLRRVDWLSGGGWSLACPWRYAEHLAQALVGAGARLCGQRAFDALRLAAAVPWYGIDISDAHLPQEVARDRQAIHFKKGCYLGQETVARIDAVGHVNRLLALLHWPTVDPPPVRCALRQGAQTVGHVTSSAALPADGGALGLAYVRRGCDPIATQLDSDHGPAQVIAPAAP